MQIALRLMTLDYTLNLVLEMFSKYAAAGINLFLKSTKMSELWYLHNIIHVVKSSPKRVTWISPIRRIKLRPVYCVLYYNIYYYYYTNAEQRNYTWVGSVRTIDSCVNTHPVTTASVTWTKMSEHSSYVNTCKPFVSCYIPASLC